MNLPKRVPVLANPQEGSSTLSLSSAFHATSVCLLFITNSVTKICRRHHPVLMRLVISTQGQGSAATTASAHFATAEAETPVEWIPIALQRGQLYRKISHGACFRLIRESPQGPVRSAVNRLRNVFWLPPPTMNRRFNFFLVSVAMEESTSA